MNGRKDGQKDGWMDKPKAINPFNSYKVGGILKRKSGTDNVNADQVWLAVNHAISVTSMFETYIFAAVNRIYVFHENINGCKDVKIHKTMHSLQFTFRNKSIAFISMFICIKQRNCK